MCYSIYSIIVYSTTSLLLLDTLAAPRPRQVRLTVEHGASEPVKRMYVWVRRDASMLQVREAIASALKVKLSQAIDERLVTHNIWRYGILM